MFWLTLIGCFELPDAPPPVEWPAITAAAPIAGAAEGFLDLPIGGPLGGYSNRCGYLDLGSDKNRPDNRKNAYLVNWAASGGVHTRQALKAVWIEAGNDHLVLLKGDIIYSNDKLVAAIASRLSALTGVDLTGKVTLASSHTHHGVANYADQYHFYLGGDRYNEEVFQRFVESAAAIAKQAYDGRVPAAIGTSWNRDWDPQDRVYRDRRGDNDDLIVWDDLPPGYGKDPYLHLTRIDRLDGSPIALLVNFGMHGTLLDSDNALISTDSTGGLEAGLEAAFDEPIVVVHFQGAGGDASPAGSDRDLARIETIGEYATPLILPLYEATPTSIDPIAVETVSRHIPTSLEEIRVTRNGTVDWFYPPYQEGRLPDNQVYAADGRTLLSPLDEFNALNGGAFCGEEEALLPGYDIGADVYPYSTCVDVTAISSAIGAIFKVEVPLPLPESLGAGTSVTRLGPLTTRLPDGQADNRDLVVGFVPAEPTAMYTEQWRRRVKAEVGDEYALIVGYAQDHEGYFLLPEDWLRGGYEPNINLWGPLHAEHVMEGMLAGLNEVLSTDVREPVDPFGEYGITEYLPRELPTLPPDAPANAGALITAFDRSDEDTSPGYFWMPDGLDFALTPTDGAEVPRIAGMVQVMWEGGDPAVDFPVVTLQHKDNMGEWQTVTTPTGRPVTSDLHDILLIHTPEPLYPAEADQVHRYLAIFQAVPHWRDRAGLPEGEYRLFIQGQTYTGQETTYPWSTTPYQVAGPVFTVVPAEILGDLTGQSLSLYFQGPADGYRLIDLSGDSRGENPVRGPLTLTWTTPSGPVVEEGVTPTLSGSRGVLTVSPPADATALTVTDVYGNRGRWDLVSM